jgi:ABC-2 type transport system ATP-binding protein
MTDQAITIRGLEKSFATFKLGPLDLNVPAGAIYGFIGPNGAGKTTTIDLIMGMGREDTGQIKVFGLDHIEEDVEVKKRVGYVSPDLVFNAWGSVNRLVSFMRSFYDDWDDAYCSELLDRFAVGVDDRIATLSYGARTKLSLVVALSHRPALLLLDEPQAGLDAVSKRELFAELLAAVQDENRTVLISSHNLDELERFTDCIGIISNGRLLIEGPTADLLERFRTFDCTLDGGVRAGDIPGIRVQSHRGDRWHLLADMKQDAAEHLKQYGATSITETPVTLEELFIALVKDRS